MISRLADIMIAFPFIVLIIAVVAIVGPGIEGFLIGVPIAAWALYARLARSRMLVLRSSPSCWPRRRSATRDRRAIFSHAFPNLLRPCLVYSTVDLVSNLLLLAGLSYLGLGDPAADRRARLDHLRRPGLPADGLVDHHPARPGPGAFGVGVGIMGEGLADRSSEGVGSMSLLEVVRSAGRVPVRGGALVAVKGVDMALERR